jgi:hypothetical protein
MTRAAWRWSLHFVVAWVATAVLVALSAFVLWNLRQDSRSLSELTLRNSGLLLAQQTEHAFDQADAVLRSVSYRYAHVSSPAERGLARLADELRNDVASNPFVKRIGIVDSSSTPRKMAGSPSSWPARSGMRSS